MSPFSKIQYPDWIVSEVLGQESGLLVEIEVCFISNSFNSDGFNFNEFSPMSRIQHCKSNLNLAA